MAVAAAGVGCGATRSPNVVIAPSYSYVKADLTTGVSDSGPVAVSTRTDRLSSASHKLPPLPAAPGFDTYVMVPTDSPID